MIRAYVKGIDTTGKKLLLDNGQTISYDKLLVATGSKSNKFGWPGQDLPGVQGLYSFQDLELLEKNTRDIKRAVIVGGGLIGIELAEMLLSRNIPVTLLVREAQYWNNVLPKNESKLVSRHIREHGMDLRLETNLKEILPGDDGRVRAVQLESGEEIPCQLVGLTPGVHPNIEVVKDTPIETNRGVLVNDYLETNIPDVYAAGDCAEIIVPDGARNRLEQLWYTGRMQGIALAKTICGERTAYERGIWFNSAKFLDIEYQTYGFVSNAPRDGEKSFYWEHPEGRHCLHIVYQSNSESVVGVNLFGIRGRHKVWESWIGAGKTIAEVLTHLPDANFDPEFFKTFETEIAEEYHRQTGKTVQVKSRKGFFARIFAA